MLTVIEFNIIILSTLKCNRRENKVHQYGVTVFFILVNETMNGETLIRSLRSKREYVLKT